MDDELTETPAESAPTIFYSYSHRDEDLKDKLDAHLSGLKRQGLIMTWHDRKITPGSDWASEIDENVGKADIFIALISSDFIASDYCWGVELARALDRHARGESIVIPVVVRPVDWHDTPLGLLQALPKDGRAVTTWNNTDEAWTDIARDLRALVQKRFRAPATVQTALPSHRRIGFSHINSAAHKLPRWTESPHDSDDCPFNANCSRYLHLKDFVLNADLWLDVTVLNLSRDPVVLTAVGTSILEVKQINYSYGYPMAARISPPTDEYVLAMPDLRALAPVPHDMDEGLVTPINREVRTRLSDPVYLPSGAPYRYLVRFRDYQQKTPNHARLRLLAEIEGETAESQVIHVFSW